MDASRHRNSTFRGSTESPDVQEYRYAKKIRQFSRYITSKMEKHQRRGEGGEHSQFLPSSHPNAAILGLLESSNCIDYESRATEGSEDM